MTITLNAAYATFAAGASVDLDNATEAALVAQGRAVYTVNPGNVFAPLTPTEQQTLRKNAVATQALVSGGGNSGFTAATYEVSGLFRLLSYVAGGVTYAVAYGANTITVTGSDASTKLITLDGSGRIVSVV